ncbi:hypothetical protein V5O48_003318 [Marasmius crinis-equi]|uniref:Uncharacterized protein n=1 Tax=Marasmius crinis-equi TaxID=585013 RepID=A0ABR3FTA4_9AGAR
MRFCIINIPLVLAFGLAADASRFVHRSTPSPPPSCMPKGQQAPGSASSGTSSLPPVASSASTKSPISTSGNNETVSQNTSIPVDTNSTINANSEPISRRFAGIGFPSFLLDWQDLCIQSGGDIFSIDSPCISLGGTRSISALLADADPCAQQDVADAMITFAKSKGVVNSKKLIAFAVAYRMHPRNAVRILGMVPATPYCSRAPINAELIGIFNEQLEGVTIGLYRGPHYPIIRFGERKGEVISEGGSQSSNDTISAGDRSDSTNSTTIDDSGASSNSPDTGSDTVGSNSTKTGSTAGTSDSTETDSSNDTSDYTDTDSEEDSTEAESTDNSPPILGDGSSSSSGSVDPATATDASKTFAPASNQTATSSDDGFEGDINDPNGR